ncbi:2-hydroxyacid dehydrogenase [Tautonia rosea]|uniref:2-hydroxyacid dehydrogenase n=1 Tax=Tautonia rosea TaxID=2728037 RepID=UPI00147606A7|nr:D-glycerate dehydrogenase [Tautonia rosea]
MPGRVFITRPIPDIGPRLIEEVADEVEIFPHDRPMTRTELLDAVQGRDGVLCMLTDRIDAEVLDAAQGCRIFANMAVGYNNLDIPAATDRGILLTNTPGILTEATADLTWTLILSVARRVVEGDLEMRSGRFPGWGPRYMLGADVSGQTLGLVGPGRIALAVAQRAIGFTMRILYTGRRVESSFEALGAAKVPLEELLQQSDFVSLHVPLTETTYHLIDAKALGLMKSTACLINTSRGPVVDERALVDALRSGQIAGAGLDVYEREPQMAQGLAECANTVLLPHLGSATRGTRNAMARKAAANLNDALRGRRPADLLNPEAWRDPPHS